MAFLLDEFSKLISAVEEAELEYAVCGGLALAIHGFPRATIDIDLLIRAESLERAFEIGKENGYNIHGLDISFKERAVEIRRVSKILARMFFRWICCSLQHSLRTFGKRGKMSNF